MFIQTWTGFSRPRKALISLSPSLSPLLRFANTKTGLHCDREGRRTSFTTVRFLRSVQPLTVKLIQFGGRIIRLYFPKSQFGGLIFKQCSCTFSLHQTHLKSHRRGSVPQGFPQMLHTLHSGRFPLTQWCYITEFFDSTSTLQASLLYALGIHSSCTQTPQFSQNPPLTTVASHSLQYVGLSRKSVKYHLCPLYGSPICNPCFLWRNILVSSHEINTTTRQQTVICKESPLHSSISLIG